MKEIVSQSNISRREVGTRWAPGASYGLVPDYSYKIRKAGFEARFLKDRETAATRNRNRVLVEEVVDELPLGAETTAPER